MFQPVRSALLVAGAMAAMSAASAATYQYDFQSYYDNTTLRLGDLKTYDTPVASLLITDQSAGVVKFTLDYKVTNFPAGRQTGAPFLDELWLGGGRGTLKSTSGPGLSLLAGYTPLPFFTEGGQKYNWDIQFKNDSFSEGNKAVFTITGSGLSAATFASVVPSLQLEGVGGAQAGWFGLSPVTFVGKAVTNPIPEPGTYAMMGLGLVGLALVRRRRAR